MPDKLAKAKQLISLMNEGVTKDEFTRSFANLTNLVIRVQKELMQRIDNETATVKRLPVGPKGDKGDKGEIGLTGKQGSQGIRGVQGPLGKNGLNGKDGSPDTPRQVKDKLLTIGLSVNDIQGLRNVLDEHDQRIGKGRIADQTAIGVLRHQLTYYDLSSFLDGTTTTFNLPSFQKIVQITLSSYPTILRPGVDFTFSNSPSQVTFIGVIAANKATILSAGETVVLLMNA